MVLLLYTLHLSGNLARFSNNLVAPQVDVPNLGRVLQARPQGHRRYTQTHTRR